ncbi:MAG: class I SAM-dependent methyltransferase [Planctomycetota bacterium]|nr:class I SAM-dependent methyltransferase [Planctomycetota bacterium]
MVKCASCGFLYTNPMPSVAECYEEHRDETYIRSCPQRRRTADHAVSILRRYQPSGRLLDIGCATGIFLDSAARFYQVEGLELSRWAYEEAAKRHKVHNVPLDRLKVDKPFDIATLFGVIEHFEDPYSAMQCVARLLRPGGLLVVYTGDVDSWLPRWLGKKWWWFQGMHLCYFSRRTCELLLSKCGFDTVHVGTLCVYFQLYSLGVSLKRYRLGALMSPLLNLPGLRRIMVPVKLSGEMLLLARRRP